MELSWPEVRAKCKSPLRTIARFLWKSRQAKSQKNRALKQERHDDKRTIHGQNAKIQQQEKELLSLRLQLRQQEVKIRQQAATTRLPDDPPLQGHQFGPRLIRLAVSLARIVGLRSASRVLKVVWEWLGLTQELPNWTTIRIWLMRLGVAALREPVESADDWVWMADHSNQIGPEKALVVLAVRASQLPPPGETLKHEDVRVLTVQPGTAWKREDVATVYRQLAEQHGQPRAVLCDGAVELRDGAECLKIGRPDTIVLRDFKHKAAIFLKTAVGNHPRFAEFNTLIGKTRCAIQQTELAHLTPPGQRPKARFMNLAPLLDWAATVLWLLDHPEAKACESIKPERLEEKLGWLRSFASELASWRECQQAVSASVTFINQQGLYRGASRQLHAAIVGIATCESSRQLVEQLVDFVGEAEAFLQDSERLPMSTEILESSFALYKQLERQHSKGGFTSLLAAFGALLKMPTEATIRRAFATVSTRAVHDWVRQNLGPTLTTKRLAAYKEFRHATKMPAPT